MARRTFTQEEKAKAVEWIRKKGLRDKWLNGKEALIPFAERHGFKNKKSKKYWK